MRASRVQYRRRKNPSYVDKFVPLPGIAPKKIIVNFNTCGTVALTGDGTNKTEDNVITLNDPTDWSIAASLQPQGWEQWAGFYHKAHVLSMSISVTFTNVGLAAGAHHVGLNPDEDSTSMQSATLDSYTWCGYPRVQIRTLLGPLADAVDGGQAKQTTIKYHCRPNRFLDLPTKSTTLKIELPDTSPPKLIYLHTLMSRQDTAVMQTNDIVNVLYRIRWKVHFYERKNLALGTDT